MMELNEDLPTWVVLMTDSSAVKVIKPLLLVAFNDDPTAASIALLFSTGSQQLNAIVGAE